MNTCPMLLIAIIISMMPSVINEKSTTLDDRNIVSMSNELSLNYNGKEDEMEKLFINEK